MIWTAGLVGKSPILGENKMTEIIPGYFIHTPDEKFGPYANIMEADTAAEKLMAEGVQVLGITKEGFEGVVSFEALEYSAESKLPPAEKAGITGVTSGATMEGLETLLAADEDACPVCEGDMDFDEAYRVYPYTLCYDCAGADQDKRYDHAYSAEGELEETQEELAEVRTELSKSRTSMSMIRTGLAIAGFILLWEHHKWAKEEHDSKENRV